MRNIAFILFSILISNEIFGTAQIPDLLIYNNDTVSLYANPLESYFTNNNPRPDYIGVEGCWSTACWRGYQAIWEIKDNKLYLNSILDCCFWKEYLITSKTIKDLSEILPQEIINKLEKLKNKQFDSYDFKETLKKKLGKNVYKKHKEIILNSSIKPRQKADLTKLFKGKVVEDKVWASWFSGDLSIPKGKMIEYVHMGYMSKYEKELVLTIEKGELIEAIEYNNESREIDKEYGILHATSYSVVVPLDLINDKNGYEYTMADTIEYTNNAQTKSLSAMSKFNDRRMERDDRIKLVEITIDSLSNELSNKYTFDDKKTKKVRWGTACWIDGQSKTTNEVIRIFTMSNINSQVIIEYKEKNIKPNDFEIIADYIINSVQLMEFGY